jgi:hypothetical protein
MRGLKPLTSKTLKSPATNAEDAIGVLLGSEIDGAIRGPIGESADEPRALLYGLGSRL